MIPPASWTRTPTALGVAPLAAFAFFSAAVDVYAGGALQRIDPMVLAALSFTAVGVISVVVNEVRGPGGTWSKMRRHRADVIALNLTTAVTWLSLLYALKYVEPAIANVVSIAIGPACTVLLLPLWGRGGRPLRVEVAVSAAVVALIAILVWASFTGRSAVAVAHPQWIAIGLVGAVVSGIASALNIIYSKRLSVAGLSPVSVMAVRYFAIVAITWPFAIGSGVTAFRHALFPALVVGVIGIAVPMYLLQSGIRHVEAITAAMLINLAPALTFVLQFFDGRLRQSAISLACIAGITVLVIAGVATRIRSDRRAAPLLLVAATNDGAA
jgi:drug/metabolite transporter (DMT)-like permease